MSTCYIPENLTEALEIRKKTHAIPLAGGTDLMVQAKNGIGVNPSFPSPVMIITNLKELRGIRVEDDGTLVIGALATSSEIAHDERVFFHIRKAASQMGAVSLRNTATIGGNIASWRDDSFLIPTLSASGAELTVVSSDGEKERMSIEDYGVKRGLILSVSIPASADVRNFRESLTSHSHAVVTASFGEGECYAVKGSGIFFSYDELKFNDDMFGSASYKSYLATLYRKESGRV